MEAGRWRTDESQARPANPFQAFGVWSGITCDQEAMLASAEKCIGKWQPAARERVLGSRRTKGACYAVVFSALVFSAVVWRLDALLRCTWLRLVALGANVILVKKALEG